MQKDLLAECQDWSIDWEGFESKISEKTKLIILNSPHNPTGKIFTQDQIDRICEVALKYPKIILVEDNVYQGFMFDEWKGKFMPKVIHSKHYPKLKERTLDVYSAGKLLEATGTRGGWIIGDKDILKLIHKFNKTIVGETSALVQNTVTKCLNDICSNDYQYLALEASRLEKHRRVMLEALSNCKYDFQVAVPKAGYFVLVDISRVEIKEKFFNFRLEPGQDKNNRDLAFCYQMAFEDGVVAVPCSSFFDLATKDQKFVRFALCKSIQAIQKAGQRIKQQKQSQDKPAE